MKQTVTIRDWEATRLKNIANINANSLSASTPPDFVMRYIEISNVNSHGIISDDNIRNLLFEDAPSRARRIVNDGDTLISSVRPNLQAVAYIDTAGENFIASTGFNVVSPKINRIFSKYLYYLLISEDSKQYFESVAKGVGYPAVDEKDFLALSIVLPSFKEQKCIIAYLEKTCASIDAAIDIKRKQLDTLEALRKSIIHKAVTQGLDDSMELKDSGVEWLGKIPAHWKITKLKRVLSSPLTYGTNEAAELEDKNLPRYIRITDFRDNGNLRDETFKSLPLEKAEGYYLYEGDILFARSGATVGKTFQFKNYDGIACYAGYLIKATPNEHILVSDYLYYFTKSPSYDVWKDLIFTQATIQNISATKYAYLPITLPPIDEQNKIVQFIDQKTTEITRLKTNISTQIATLENYRKSLIHECVTGKRRITEDDLAPV